MGWWNKLFGTKKQNNDLNKINLLPEDILLRDFIQTPSGTPVMMSDYGNPAEETAFYLKTALHDFAGENQSHQSDWLSGGSSGFDSSDYSGFKNSDGDY